MKRDPEYSDSAELESLILELEELELEYIYFVYKGKKLIQ
jgi:hypothetical protein